MKLAAYCVVIYALIFYVSAADGGYNEGEACLIQYLQRKGKLDNSFKSVETPSPNCLFVMPLTKMVVRKTFTDRIEKEIPNHSDCLIKEFDRKETLDLLIKISVIQESNDKAELESTRKELTKDLASVMFHCDTNDEHFVIIFNDYLGNKNETLAVLQQDYCLAKYVAENNILDLKNVELNPHQIDTTKLDCNEIVEKHRNESERDLTEKISSLRNGPKVLKCVLDAYRNGDVFNSGVALKVLYNLDVQQKLKDSEKIRLTQKLSEFGLATFTCT